MRKLYGPEHRAKALLAIIQHTTLNALIAQLCQRMLLIDHGRLLYDGAIAAIRDRFGVERTLVVDLAEDETLAGPLTVGPATQVRADGP